MGYGQHNRTHNVRILKAARRSIHFFNGLPEPGKTIRYLNKFVQQYVKAIDQQNPNLMPTNTGQKRNRMSKVQQILAQNPEILHKAWRQAVKNYGDKASFKMLTEAMNTLLNAWGHEFHLKEHNVYEFF